MGAQTSSVSLVRDSSECRVSESEKIGLKNLVAILKNHDLNSPSEFIEAALRFCPILAPSFERQLTSLKTPDSDFLFVENLPKFSTEDETRRLALLISVLLGEPFQYRQQNHGEIVARITPELGHEDTNSSSGRIKFGWHSDDSCLDERYRADFILLGGFYNPNNVLTFVSPLDEICDILPIKTLSDLMMPKYNLGIPTSFRSGANTVLRNTPVVWIDGSRKFNIAVSEYNVTPPRNEDRAPLAALLEAANQNAISFNLQPGNMLIFKNNRVLHARGQIPGERTVFRVYIKESLHHLRNATNNEGFVFDLKRLLETS